ncbi:MAG: hypothetical protein AAFS07_03335 [Pseudomonadota bacterium]
MNQISPELACLSAMRTARRQFFERVVDRAHTHAPDSRRDGDDLARDYVALLRNDGTAQIAEFYFAIREVGLNNGERFVEYVKNHNRSIAEYEADPAKRAPLGLSPQRLESAKFNEQQINFIREMSPPGRLLLDQSALGRLLVETMAPETCRKLVVALADAGLLHRSKVGAIVVWSDGTLEGLYREHMSQIVAVLRETGPCPA